MLFAKMMFGLIDNVTAKATPKDAASILDVMFETCVDKVDAMTTALENAFERVDRAKRGEESLTMTLLVEKARPVAGATCAIEKPEDVIQGQIACEFIMVMANDDSQNAVCCFAPFCMDFECALWG